MSLKAHVPSRKYSGDAGFDLWTADHMEIPAGGFVDVHTHVRIRMPSGVWGRITNRSSTFRNWHLQVVEGIIDQGYTGELFVGVINPNGRTVVVPPNTRIAQLIFHTLVVPVGWSFTTEEVLNSHEECERGAKGFGSTGK